MGVKGLALKGLALKLNACPVDRRDEQSDKATRSFVYGDQASRNPTEL